MKKQTSILVSLFAFTLLTLSGLRPAFANPVTIQGLQGDVLIRPMGAAQWAPAVQGGVLAEGDAIKTNPGSAAVLDWQGVGNFQVSEATEVTVSKAKFQASGHEAELNVKIGTLKAKLNKQKSGSSFQLVTPTSVTGVRGTTFLITVKANGETFHIVVEGSITVQNIASGTVTKVVQGQTTKSTSSGTEEASAEEAAEMQEVASSLDEVIAAILADLGNYSVTVEAIEQEQQEQEAESASEAGKEITNNDQHAST